MIVNKRIELFTDSSVNSQTKIGFAAYLQRDDKSISLEALKNIIKIKKFENSSSTKLELQSFLWALDEIKEQKKDILDYEIVVYTDCQNIISLKTRKERLEKNNYHSSTGKLISNHDLYIKFYEEIDKLDISFVKVKGHKKTILKDEIDNIFNLVDKASRNALRVYK